MRLYRNNHINIFLQFPDCLIGCNPQGCSIIHTLRYLYINFIQFLYFAAPMTAWTRMINNISPSSTNMTASDLDNPAKTLKLFLLYLSLSLAIGTNFWSSTSCSARPSAFCTYIHTGNGYLSTYTAIGLFQCNFYPYPFNALLWLLKTPSACAEEITEDTAAAKEIRKNIMPENVFQIAHMTKITPRKSFFTKIRCNAGMSILIISDALVIIDQYFIRLGNFFKFFFC